MQSETQLYETVASGCPTEHNIEVYQELIICHQFNRCASDCSQPCNDVNICEQSRNASHNNDVTDASNCVNCYCASVEALVSLTSSQAECFKQDAEYLEIVNDSACCDRKPSNCEAKCRDQHDDDYLHPVADDDYLHPVADDDYLLSVALDFR